MNYSWVPDLKDPLIALILSLLLPGVGQIYVGMVARGIFVLVFGAFSWLPGLFFINMEATFFIGFIWWMMVATIIFLIVYIWQVVDAYHLAEQHDRPGNAQMRY